MTEKISESYFKQKASDEIIALLLRGPTDKSTLYKEIDHAKGTIRARLKEGFEEGLFGTESTFESRIYVHKSKIPGKRLESHRSLSKVDADKLTRDDISSSDQRVVHTDIPNISQYEHEKEPTDMTDDFCKDSEQQKNSTQGSDNSAGVANRPSE